MKKPKNPTIKKTKKKTPFSPTVFEFSQEENDLAEAILLSEHEASLSGDDPKGKKPVPAARASSVASSTSSVNSDEFISTTDVVADTFANAVAVLPPGVERESIQVMSEVTRLIREHASALRGGASSSTAASTASIMARLNEAFGTLSSAPAAVPASSMAAPAAFSAAPAASSAAPASAAPAASSAAPASAVPVSSMAAPASAAPAFSSAAPASSTAVPASPSAAFPAVPASSAAPFPSTAPHVVHALAALSASPFAPPQVIAEPLLSQQVIPRIVGKHRNYADALATLKERAEPLAYDRPTGETITIYRELQRPLDLSDEELANQAARLAVGELSRDLFSAIQERLSHLSPWGAVIHWLERYVESHSVRSQAQRTWATLQQGSRSLRDFSKMATTAHLNLRLSADSDSHPFILHFIDALTVPALRSHLYAAINHYGVASIPYPSFRVFMRQASQLATDLHLDTVPQASVGRRFDSEPAARASRTAAHGFVIGHGPSDGCSLHPYRDDPRRSGHKTADCKNRSSSSAPPSAPRSTSPSPARALSDMTCFRCGKTGHVRSDCPLSA